MSFITDPAVLNGVVSSSPIDFPPRPAMRPSSLASRSSTTSPDTVAGRLPSDTSAALRYRLPLIGAFTRSTSRTGVNGTTPWIEYPAAHDPNWVPLLTFTYRNGSAGSSTTCTPGICPTDADRLP